MRAATVVWSFLSLAIACTPTRRADEIKEVAVTEERLRAYQADKPFVLELMRDGTLYEVASGADPTLVEVRGPARTVRLSVLARRFEGSGNTLLLGTFNDLSARGFGFPPDKIPDTGAVARTCIAPTPQSPGICSCTGRKDCSDMDQAN